MSSPTALIAFRPQAPRLLADKSRVDQREQVEAWADAVLEGNRSAPAGTASIEDDLFAEQIRRNRERHRTFAAAEAIFSMIGVVLLCLFVYSLYSTF